MGRQCAYCTNGDIVVFLVVVQFNDDDLPTTLPVVESSPWFTVPLGRSARDVRGGENIGFQ